MSAEAPPPPGAPELEALAAAYERALALEKSGAADAAEAWRAVLALDPEDRGGAAVRLAALGAGPDPDRAPPAYVETLFDQHAEAFEEILVGRLGYRVPEALADRLAALAGPEARLSVLDLGCGTGLGVAALGELAARADGVDLSAGMLEAAAETDLYDALYQADAVAFLEGDPDADPEAELRDADGDPLGPWDLILAADVAPYLGDLGPLLRAAARRLAPGGRLALSTETLPEGAFDARGWRVGPHQRFHHAEAHLRARSAEAGLAVERLEPWTIRTNEGRPEPGHLLVARRPAD